MTLDDQIRVNRIRSIGADQRKRDEVQREERFWAEVDANELRINDMRPLCSTCRFDMHNQSFHV